MIYLSIFGGFLLGNLIQWIIQYYKKKSLKRSIKKEKTDKKSLISALKYYDEYLTTLLEKDLTSFTRSKLENMKRNIKFVLDTVDL